MSTMGCKRTICIIEMYFILSSDNTIQKYLYLYAKQATTRLASNVMNNEN